MIFPNAGSRMFRAGDAFPPIDPYRFARPLGSGIPVRIRTLDGSPTADPYGEVNSYIMVPGNGSVDRLPNLIRALIWDGASWDVDITLTAGFGGSATINKTIQPGRSTSYYTGDSPATVEDPDNEVITSIAHRYQRRTKSGDPGPTFRDGTAAVFVEHETVTPDFVSQMSFSFRASDSANSATFETVDYYPENDKWVVNMGTFQGSINAGGLECSINDASAGGTRDDSSILVMGRPLVCWVANGSVSGSVTLASRLPMY